MQTLGSWELGELHGRQGSVALSAAALRTWCAVFQQMIVSVHVLHGAPQGIPDIFTQKQLGLTTSSTLFAWFICRYARFHRSCRISNRFKYSLSPCGRSQHLQVPFSPFSPLYSLEIRSPWKRRAKKCKELRLSIGPTTQNRTKHTSSR